MARKAVGSAPAARLPCWCLRRGRACRAWARRSGAAPRRGAQGTKGTTWGPGGGYTPSGRAQPRADSKSARAHAPCGDHDHLGVSVRPRKPPARAHGACRPPHPVLVVMLIKNSRNKILAHCDPHVFIDHVDSYKYIQDGEIVVPVQVFLFCHAWLPVALGHWQFQETPIKNLEGKPLF